MGQRQSSLLVMYSSSEPAVVTTTPCYLSCSPTALPELVRHAPFQLPHPALSELYSRMIELPVAEQQQQQ